MALEQIIADLDDLEERVENLNVDQKTNEDILLNVLKRVDETEKDLRKVCLPSIRRESLELLARRVRLLLLVPPPFQPPLRAELLFKCASA